MLHSFILYILKLNVIGYFCNVTAMASFSCIVVVRMRNINDTAYWFLHCTGKLITHIFTEN